VPVNGGLAWSCWFLPYIEEGSMFGQMNMKADMRQPPNWQADLSGATNTPLSVYLCPSMSRHQSHRGEDGRLIDWSGGGYHAGSGEGMGCIDYIGVSGPAQSVINPRTRVAYGDNRGVLLNLASGGPCFGTAPECNSKKITLKNISDGTAQTIIVAECSGRGVADSNGDLPGANTNELDGAWASKSNVGKLKLNIDVDKVSGINPPAHINWAEEEFFSDHPNGVNILMCDGSVHFLLEDTHYNVYYALCSRNGEEVLDGTFSDE
jgi:prepilin-type processing-associated H-X9-DG protein